VSLHPRHRKEEKGPAEKPKGPGRVGRTSPHIYLPKGGLGLLYDGKGKAVVGLEKGAGKEKPKDGRPTAHCSYCGKEKWKVLVRTLTGGRRYHLPARWRKLPNGCTECPACRPVTEIGTGRKVRPDPSSSGRRVPPHRSGGGERR
jgi:hypothetical protein